MPSPDETMRQSSPPSVPPRLLMICRSFHPLGGGAQHHASELARAWAALGGQCTIASGRFDPAWPECETWEDGRVRVRRLPSPRTLRGLGTTVWLMALRRFLILNRDRYDAILVSFLKYEAMLSGWMRQRLNVPVVARAEGAGQGAGDIHVLSTLWSGRLIASGIRRVDRLVAISRRAAAQIEGAGFDPTRIVTIPNGVDCEKYRPSGCGDKRMESRRAFDPAILPESPVLLALGRLIPVKGLDVLLRALAPRSENAEDRLKSLPWRLWIAGDGPQRAPLGELAESLGLTARVRFLGQVENTPDLLRAADVFVQPSHGEGLSLALLEAMASGLAVVASRVSGSEDRIRPGENGLLVEPGDEGGLRHALIEVLHAPRLRARLGAGARLDAETNCAFPRVARQYAELFRQLASPGTRTS